MINDQGGINGRKLNLIEYYDAYSPPKAVEQVRKLVEGDEVLFTFQVPSAPLRTLPCRSTSTPGRCRNCSPPLARRASPIRKKRSWKMIAFNPNYQSEARIYAKYILKNHPNAKIGNITQV